MCQFWDEGEEIPEGSNIIAILPGSRFQTPQDRLVVVGAHWDTTPFTDGYNDNGFVLQLFTRYAHQKI